MTPTLHISTELSYPRRLRISGAVIEIMMTSSNGAIFCVTGPLWAEFAGNRWISLTKTSDAELWCFLWSAPEQTVEKTMETPWFGIVSPRRRIKTPAGTRLNNNVATFILRNTCDNVIIKSCVRWNGTKPLHEPILTYHQHCYGIHQRPISQDVLFNLTHNVFA